MIERAAKGQWEIVWHEDHWDLWGAEDNGPIVIENLKSLENLWLLLGEVFKDD